jgi:hypothetical protein
MLNHVASLIVDFKLIKIIIILSLYAQKIYKNHIHLFLNHAKILGCYSLRRQTFSAEPPH